MQDKLYNPKAVAEWTVLLRMEREKARAVSKNSARYSGLDLPLRICLQDAVTASFRPNLVIIHMQGCYTDFYLL